MPIISMLSVTLLIVIILLSDMGRFPKVSACLILISYVGASMITTRERIDDSYGFPTT